MAMKPVMGRFFPVCTFLSIVGEGIDGQTAPGKEFSPHFYVLGIQYTDQVFHDYIHAVFMKITMIAETEQVQFQ